MNLGGGGTSLLSVWVAWLGLAWLRLAWPGLAWPGSLMCDSKMSNERTLVQEVGQSWLAGCDQQLVGFSLQGRGVNNERMRERRGEEEEEETMSGLSLPRVSVNRRVTAATAFSPSPRPIPLMCN